MLQEPVGVLIIDDSPEILEVVSIMLTRHGYKVHGRTRMGNFIREIKDVSPDVVIIDQHLGWADGCDLCSSLKADENLQQLPVIMFSAYHTTKEKCIFCGADAFLAKPFDMNALLETIESLTK